MIKLLKIIIAVLFAFVAYVGIAWGLSWVPIHTDFVNATTGTDVYVRSNGVHTDIVLPLAVVADLVPAQDLHNQKGLLQYVSFGWGDKGFYLDTPTWADLKASTAFIAATGLGSTAMHVEAVEQPVVGQLVRHIRVNDTQLAALLTHIKTSFVYDANQKVEEIDTNANYNEHDAFYEAKGRYSMFTTCNGWTRDGLSAAQIRTALFTPFAEGVLRHLPIESNP